MTQWKQKAPSPPILSEQQQTRCFLSLTTCGPGPSHGTGLSEFTDLLLTREGTEARGGDAACRSWPVGLARTPGAVVALTSRLDREGKACLSGCSEPLCGGRSCPQIQQGTLRAPGCPSPDTCGGTSVLTPESDSPITSRNSLTPDFCISRVCQLLRI